MPGVMSLVEAAAMFSNIEHKTEEMEHAIIVKACIMVAEEAKRVIGTYDYNWVPLAESTLKQKAADTPLLETGEMRDSIGWWSEGLEGQVGSNSDIAVYQELGTSHIPPRSFLVGAAQHMEDKIHTMAARAVRSVLGGSGLHSSEMAELLHVLKHVGHELKETVKELLEPDEDENGSHRR